MKIPLRIFISSVQSEFAREREALRGYLRADELYLDEVEQCDLYVGLFGEEYGTEDDAGLSPTEREFDHATALGKHRLIFMKAVPPGDQHPKMKALIAKAQGGLIRKQFSTTAELLGGLYAALVEFLESKDLLRFGPFDAAPCFEAEMDDLDFAGMARFIRAARRIRQLPMDEETAPEDLLEHLNLLNKGRLTNAAVLLFGKAPQRFLISSEIKCAHFHGTMAGKPIPSYQVYKGTVFDLVDQAVDFVLSKIALSVGTRAESVEVPIAYEIPKEVVTEAIVNAVAHCDYTDSSSVQVMLFADRLDVMNSGQLPPPLTVEKLRVAHESLPGNPLLAQAMYLRGYIEQMGTGTVDMIRRCAKANLPEPEFVAHGNFVTTIRRAGHASIPARMNTQTKVSASPEKGTVKGGIRVYPQSERESRPESLEAKVIRLLGGGPMSKAELSKKLGQKEISGQLNKVVRQLVADDRIEFTLPSKPRSRLQKYRLTDTSLGGTANPKPRNGPE